jgi:hypothetical protein
MPSPEKDISGRLKALEQSFDIVPLRDKRVIPDAMTLVSRAETRCGLWWYDPASAEFKFSASARSHYKFDGMPRPAAGWVRGAVFEKEGAYYLLIYACDFISSPLSGKILNDIYQKTRVACAKEIFGIVTEEGFSLL